LLLINTCLYAVTPVLAHAGEEKITRFEPERAESEAAAEDGESIWMNWWPWGISAAILGFIIVGIGSMKKSGGGGNEGAIDVGW